MKRHNKKRFLFGGITLGLLLFAAVARMQTPVHAEDTRVITVHVDGEEKTVASNADTVKEVLEKIEMPLGDNDKTEPALDSPITGYDFTVNVYRARPITVVDGVNNFTVMTAERSPRQIAKEAGFETKSEDKFGFVRSEDPFEGSPGTQMVIKRSQTINLDLYGVTSSLNTHEQTVGALLTERGIKLEAGDELNVPKQAPIVEGMTISIANVSRSVETVEEDVPFEEEKIQDVNQPTSYKEVKTPGANGKKLVTYEIVSRNGGAPERVVKEEVVTKQPVKQVVVVGAKVAAVTGTCGEWMSQAGITNADAIWLIGKESGCNPRAVNRSSGACGIPQSLPCSKMGPVNADGTSAVSPVGQLQWMTNYVMGRYGSWAAARAHHASRGWY